MAVSGKVGRPYQVADINFVDDPDLELYERFYEACSDLCYSDTVVLARTFGFQERTIRNWKAGFTFPPKTMIATKVILWVKNGKPRRVITQASASAGVL
ncbi:MAG: hypothetical protein KAT35_03880 [Candidatus Aenigmarchaeota archaeon]|nr:hypothetical protein [Candidatus Aenigmarchaeota archaeon]